MSRFWELAHDESRPAVHDSVTGTTLDYGALARATDEVARALPEPEPKKLGFVFGSNRTGTLLAYLAALRRGDAVFLGNPRLDLTLRERLVEVYRPDWVAAPAQDPDPSGYRRGASPLDPWDLALSIAPRATPPGEPLQGDLGLLLSTSGTTGSPKLVRLTRTSVQANAASIREYLALGPDERPLAALPFHYSFGLSIVNSHLLAGGTLLLTDHSVVEREFWRLLATQRATSLSGVPFTYATLHRLRFDPARHPSLRTLTQAGGRLDLPLQEYFLSVCRAASVRFFVMYGQTEATARISYVPPETLHDKLGSIGVAIPGGELSLDGETAEILYRGPNVMQGYATSRADLSKGDECRGLLRTGDLGRIDDDGYFFITGRMKRFLKLHGHRVNLDELEAALFRDLGEVVACHGVDDQLLVLVENASRRHDVEQLLLLRYAINPNGFRVITGQPIPRTDAGKIDYPRILAAHLSP